MNRMNDIARYLAPFLTGSLVLLIAAWTFFVPAAADAHSNEYLATMKGDHGGMLRMAGNYHFELVLADGKAQVWVTDHGGTVQSTKGASGTLRVINGSGSVSVRLAPAGGNGLMGTDPRIKLQKGTKLLLVVNMGGDSPLETRFALE